MSINVKKLTAAIESYESDSLSNYQCDYPEPEQFKKLFRKVRSVFKAALKEYGFTVKLQQNHTSWSGFAERDGQYIYLSGSNFDVNSFLIRTASGQKDYTGGRNNYIEVKSFDEDLRRFITNNFEGMVA